MKTPSCLTPILSFLHIPTSPPTFKVHAPILIWTCPHPSQHQNAIFHHPTSRHPLGKLRCRTCTHPKIWNPNSPRTRVSSDEDILFYKRMPNGGYSDARLHSYAIGTPRGRVGYICHCCGMTWRTESRRGWWGGEEKVRVVGGRVWCRCGTRVFRWGEYSLFEVVEMKAIKERGRE
ncbi:hypothetical protein P153DRAFT_381262 [Dothidotthia symphoricarpi CBS 119687]|uniref:Probable double zinc ribbon domain-containing protein n=1 Tax=Dothidotthia symphoricarpi CBS 119687 TaxID=1392245 RepID=A0A6A6ASF1_9PLEO|nr:uncharacterized protein P153DRAFT_381262 [Dothidotthia symphoricarpi CBS 119687]KAF2134088.1 hypothetical protein P153DRAFT_381262 [Dothidotthia symphoricarpi CBS 119687]